MLAEFAQHRLEDFAKTNRPTLAIKQQGKRDKRDERGSRAAKACRLEDSLFDERR